MSIELLESKLFIPPIRPNLVPRPHLISQLTKKSDLGCKVTLIPAQAGFGKTTLVMSWMHESDLTTAWFSLDERVMIQREFCLTCLPLYENP